MINNYLEKIRESSFLITGGAGFIGSHIVDYLIKIGAKRVRVLDNLSTGLEKNLKDYFQFSNFEFINGDILNIDTCTEACKGIDYVSHQAALGSVPRSINDPITTNNVNIGGFLNMIVAARDSNIKRFVYAASSSTYGDSLVLPKIEDRIGKPLSPYAVTKYVNELYADVFSKIYGLETIGLRYFNVFGPRQRSDGPYAAVIPLFFESFYKKTPPLIYGDGEQTRDFTFVFNVVEANILAMLNSNSLVINQIFNIAAGERTSLNSLATQISRLTNNENILPIYKNSRVGDVRDSLADISKAKNILEYIPKFTLREGLEIMNNSFGIDNKEFIF